MSGRRRPSKNDDGAIRAAIKRSDYNGDSETGEITTTVSPRHDNGQRRCSK